MSVKRLLFALLPTIVLFGSAELYVRSAGLTSDTYESGGSLGWTARPNLLDYRYQSRANSTLFSVTTNEDGLRTPYTRERTPGVNRMMVFGESTIFGWGVPEDGAPAARLEAALGDGWEVVNGGQPGYTSEQVLRLSRLAVPAYRPDVVVMFHTWNDHRFAEKVDRDFLPDHAAVARNKWWAQSAVLRWLTEPKDGDASGEMSAKPAPIFSFREAQGGEVSRVPPEHRVENIAAVAEVCRSVGARLVLATLPPGAPGVTALRLCPFVGTKGSGKTTGHPVCLELSTAADQAGAPFFDLTSAIQGQREDLLLLYADPGHFTALGNELFMRSLATQLLAHLGMEE